MSLLARLCVVLALAVAPAAQAQNGPRILAIGDSMLAAHSISGRAVADHLEAFLGTDVTDRSVLGAWMHYKLPITGSMGLSIPRQFRDEQWDWVIVNGGGNDLWLGCGCHSCDRKLNKLIAPEGNFGALPKLFAGIIAAGGQAVYVGYLRSPGVFTPIEDCRDEGDILEARIAALAARVPGIHYVSMQDLVPHGDRSFHALDGIHPSLKGSQKIASRVAAYLKPRAFQSGRP